MPSRPQFGRIISQIRPISRLRERPSTAGGTTGPGTLMPMIPDRRSPRPRHELTSTSAIPRDNAQARYGVGRFGHLSVYGHPYSAR